MCFSSNSLLVVFRVFYISCHLQLQFYFFPISMSLFLYLVWSLWLRFPILCWIKVARVDILVLFLILRGKARSFSLLSMFLAVGLSYITFIMLQYTFPLCPLGWEFLSYGCWSLSNAFSASTEMNIWLSSFILLMWFITLIDLQMVKQPWIPGINVTWSWYMILLVYCWIQFTNILLVVFVSMFTWDISL